MLQTNFLLLSFIFLQSLVLGCNLKPSHESQFDIRKLWVRQGPDTSFHTHRRINRMKPILTGDMLIAGNSIDGITAFNSHDGNTIWTFKNIQGVEGGAAVFKDRVYFGASNGVFYCLNIKDGKVQWSFDSKAEILSEPSLNTDQGFVYFINASNTLFALEAATGKQVWNFNRQDTAQFTIRGISKPIYAKDHLIAGFSDGSVIDFGPTNGQIKWEQMLNRNKKFRDIDSNPLVIGEQVFVTGYDDKLYALSLTNGQVQWKIDGGGYSEIAHLNSKIYFPTTQGEVWAVKKETGQIAWKYPIKNGISGGVQIYKNLVVFGESGGQLRFLNTENGKQTGQFDPGRGILASVLADENSERIFFVSNESNIYALEAKWNKPHPFPWLKGN